MDRGLQSAREDPGGARPQLLRYDAAHLLHDRHPSPGLAGVQGRFDSADAAAEDEKVTGGAQTVPDRQAFPDAPQGNDIIGEFRDKGQKSGARPGREDQGVEELFGPPAVTVLAWASR